MLNLPLHPVEVNTPKKSEFTERESWKESCVDVNMDSEGQ